MSTQAQTINEAERGDNFDSNITPADYQPSQPSTGEVIYVRCDSPDCNEHAFDTRETLKRAGWDLMPGAAFCAIHWC
jgi:hypothetical protein